MTTSTTRSRQNTRARLLDAAAEVFAEVGLEGATVEAVCERAGFTRGAFYSNFDSKDELFLMLAATVGEQRVAAVRERISALAGAGAMDDCDPADLVQQVMDSGADDRLSVMLLSEIRIRALRDDEFAAAYMRQERELLASIAEIIRELVEGGSFTLRVDATTAARLLMTVWEGMAVRGAMSGDGSDQLRHAASVELGRLVELMRA